MSMSKCRVLIVDDIAENIAQMVNMLSNLDIEIKKAYGGKEAIELVETYRPNIILLDLMMPEVNGWDVIEHVRARYDKNEMIIIITSLLNNKDNIDECYEMGVNDYVAKPIIPGRIISSVETQMRNVKFAEYESKAEQHQLKTQPASVVEMDPAKYTG